MNIKAARAGRRKGAQETQACARRRIRKSMLNWEAIDGPGRYLGRGLGRKELIGRVAREVGKTVREVQSALRRRAGGGCGP